MSTNGTHDQLVTFSPVGQAMLPVDSCFVDGLGPFNGTRPQARVSEVLVKQSQSFIDFPLDMSWQFGIGPGKPLGDDDGHGN